MICPLNIYQFSVQIIKMYVIFQILSVNSSLVEIIFYLLALLGISGSMATARGLREIGLV